GQTLSEPIIDKHTISDEDERFAFGVSEMQGWRLTMEDAHAAVLDLDSASPESSNSTDSTKPKSDKNSFFAVYDGHGGATVAEYSGNTVHFKLRSTDEYKQQDYEAALKRAFLATDEDLRKNPNFNNDPSGCTAVAALITSSGKILVANAGDSRSVLSVNGVAKPMSYDHKPVNRIENNRIVAAGGFVEFGRVNGNLALSRAIGDFEFKQNKKLTPEQQVVTADPEIITHEISSEDEFLVLACDGIWDVFSSQEVVDRARRLIGERKPLTAVAEEILSCCLAPDCEWGGVGCDNMTFMIVAILGGKTKSEWYDMICERLGRGDGYQTPAKFTSPFTPGTRGNNRSILGGAQFSNDYEEQPPSYQQNEDSQPTDSSSNSKPTGPPSVGSLFSLAPASIIEALSRVNHANFESSSVGGGGAGSGTGVTQNPDSKSSPEASNQSQDSTPSNTSTPTQIKGECKKVADS
ncbi:protein phosphatase, partial [Phakopsora pachyrhizi]